MLTPTIQILAFLTVTFALGLTLGWLLWQFKGGAAGKSIETEVQFWKQRWDQSRLELDREQSKIEALEKERDTLKGKVRKAKAAAS
jgi:hypothetical protein